jgi:hypothetical protein
MMLPKEHDNSITDSKEIKMGKMPNKEFKRMITKKLNKSQAVQIKS